MWAAHKSPVDESVAMCSKRYKKVHHKRLDPILAKSPSQNGSWVILATFVFLSLMQFQHPPIRKLAVLQNEVPLTTTTNQPIESLAKRRRTPSHPTPRADLLGQIRTESLLAAHKESATTMIRQRKDVGLEAAAAAARRKQHKLEASLLQIESTKRIPEASNP